MKIYTKAGDAGETGLLGGDKTPKIDPRIEAIGEVDELNAAIGVAEVAARGDLSTELTWIQARLFDLGAELACPPGGKFSLEGPSPSATKRLEDWIDAQPLPELKQFILPGGTELAARLHLARAICRRAERAVLRLHAESPSSAESLRFMNRLSDWLFVAARRANYDAGRDETPWTKEVKDA